MSRSNQRVLSLLLVLCLQLVATTAFAQSIVKLNEEGVTAYSEGRFEEAAQKFSQAYAIKPEPPLKKNEAVAWFKADRCSEALAAAKEYLGLGEGNDLSTREAQTVVVKCYIKRAETELAAGNDAAASTALADARANTPTDEDAQTITGLETQVQEKRDAAEQQRRMEMAAAEAEEGRRLKSESRQRTKMLGMGLVGGGGAIVVGTLIYHIALATGTSSKFKDASAAGDRATYDKLGKRLETGNWLVPTLYAVGFATAGVGGYLWWSTAEKETPTTTARGLETIGGTVSWTF